MSTSFLSFPEVGASVTVPAFSNWVADVAVPAATGALAWSCLQVAVDGIFWFTRTISVIGPCNHAFIFASSLGRPVCASSLLLSLLCSCAFLCFPLPSLFFLLFLSFVLRLFSFLLLPFWLDGFCTSVWLVFWVFCCPLLGWGFGSPRVFSVGWGFGSPRVFCLVLLCDFSVLRLWLAPCVCLVLLCDFSVLGLRLALCVCLVLLCDFSVLRLWLAPCVCLVLLCDFSVLGLRLAPCGFGSPRPRGVGHLPARVTPASACWRRRGGCFAWGCSWSWISCLVWMGPTLSRRRTRLLGIFLLFAFSSCSGATSVDPFFFWWCVASQLVGKGPRLLGLQLFCAVAWVGIDTYGVVGWELLCPL